MGAGIPPLRPRPRGGLGAPPVVGPRAPGGPGAWDPLGPVAASSGVSHGRLAMLVSLGVLAPHFVGEFPGLVAPAVALGLGGFVEVPVHLLFAHVLLVAFSLGSAGPVLLDPAPAGVLELPVALVLGLLALEAFFGLVSQAGLGGVGGACPLWPPRSLPPRWRGLLPLCLP